MAKVWADFYDNVLPDVPGVGLAFADHVIKETVIEFCNRTLIWEEDLATVVTTATSLFTLTPPTDTLIIRPQRVVLDGDNLTPMLPAELDRMYTDWRTNPSGGNALYYFMESPKVMRIIRDPAAGLDLDIRACLKPTETAAGFSNDDIYDEYREEISAGAVGKMLMTPNRPFTDMVLGTAKMREFNAYCGAAAGRKLNAYTRRARRSTPYDR